MISFEYKIVPFYKGPTQALLNVWGKDGWELCGIDNGDFIFKRPIVRDSSIKVKITDINTDEITYHDSLSRASSFLGASVPALRYSLYHHTLYFKRYKVEEDDGQD